MKSDFLNIMSERGFINQCSDLEALDKALLIPNQSAYCGFDATAPSLHVGNLISLMMLGWFKKCGHHSIILLGGATTGIGDPSGKNETRNILNNEEIEKNISSIKFPDFLAGTFKVNNAEWLEKINQMNFLKEIGVHFTINKMLAFDSVKGKLSVGKSVSFLEFNYMILQAYDFLELNKRFGTILQMGGSDQWGNIINGVELGRRKKRVELFALTSPLLLNSKGEKMGKTVSGAVWLNPDLFSPYEYFQYWRNSKDEDVERFLKYFTMLPMREIKKLSALKGAEINEAKKILAYEATELCHGHREADAALEKTKNTYRQ